MRHTQAVMQDPEGWSGPPRPTSAQSSASHPPDARALPVSPLKAPVTAVMVALAVVVTVAMYVGVDVSFMFMRPRALGPEPWRIILSALPHIGVLHILFNSSVAWSLGSVLERRLGSIRVAAIYLWLAAFSSLAQYAFSDPGVGLSGVAFGQITLLYLLERHDPWPRRLVNNRSALWFFGWFVLCIVLTHFEIIAIANWAHGAGALGGMLLGWLWVSDARRRFILPATLVALGAVYAVAAFARPMVNLGEREETLEDRLRDEI